MKYNELRKRLQLLSEREKLSHIKRSSFINSTFAGDFNYSIGEEPIMRKFGKYLPIQRDWSFSVFQPCMRIADFHKEVKKNSDRHLTVFEMSDLGGIHLKKSSDMNTLKERSLEYAFSFLTKTLKIDKKRIFLSYFAGRPLRALSNNHIQGNQYVPADEETCSISRRLGLTEKQLIPDATTRTFVLPFFPFEFYAGYRSELYVKLGNNTLLEVGSFEFLNYRTKLNKAGQLIDLLPMKGSFGGCAIGLERTLMAANNYSDIYHCDHIWPLYKKILKLSKNEDVVAARIVCEVLRLLCAIVGDGYQFDKDEYPKRKIKVKKLARQLIRAGSLLGMDLKANMAELLNQNSELVAWDLSLKSKSSIIKRVNTLVFEK